MEYRLEFDKQRYIAAANVLRFPLREYNDVLIQLIRLNGMVSLYELSVTYGVARSIRGAAATVNGLAERQLITWDREALTASHRNQPLVYGIDYQRIEQEALNPINASAEQEHYIYIQRQKELLMNYDDNASNNGRYAGQFRKDAKTENKNGQNIVSHTSLLEPGRESVRTRQLAKMWEEVDTSDDCSVHSRINRPCDSKR